MSDSQGRFLGHGRRDAQLATQKGQHTTDTVRSSQQRGRETQNSLRSNKPPEPQEGQDDQVSDDASYASAVTMIISNRSKNDSTKEIHKNHEQWLLEVRFRKSSKILIDSFYERQDLILELQDEDKKEAAAFLHQNIKEFKPLLEEAQQLSVTKETLEYIKFCLVRLVLLRQYDKDLFHERAEDKKEAAELWESDIKEGPFLRQHDKEEEVKKHQLTDAAVFTTSSENWSPNLEAEPLKTAESSFEHVDSMLVACIHTKETLEYIESLVVAGCQKKGMQMVIDHIHEEQAADKKEAAELLESDNKEASLLRQQEVKKHHPPTPMGRSADPGWLPGVGKSLLAKGWSDAQQRYFESLGKRNIGKRWLTAIIQKLWHVAGGYHRERILMRRL